MTDDLAVAFVNALGEPVLARLAERMVGHWPQHSAPGMAANDEWMDTRRAAEYAGVHPDTLRKAARAGELPYEQEGPGCKLYFRRSELEAWRCRVGFRAHQRHAA